MRFSEQNQTVYILKPADHQAGVDGDSINFKTLDHVAFYLQFGSLTGNAVLTLESGASDGTKTTSETFVYRLADAVQGSAAADTFAAETSATTLTLTAATYQNKCLIVEVPVAALTAAQPWLTLALSSAASVLNVAVLAIGSPRHAQNVPPTVI